MPAATAAAAADGIFATGFAEPLEAAEQAQKTLLINRSLIGHHTRQQHIWILQTGFNKKEAVQFILLILDFLCMSQQKLQRPCTPSYHIACKLELILCSCNQYHISWYAILSLL